MDFSLSEDQAALRREIIRFAQRELNDGVVVRDRARTFSRDLWLKCGEIGLTGLPIPDTYGGSGLDPLSSALALEAFGYGCRDSGLVFSIAAHLLACVVPIWLHGTDDQKRRLLPGLCAGTLIGSHAMTEPEAGSDAFAMTTTADRDGDGFRIRGVKTFATNLPVADVALVFAVTDREQGYLGGFTGFVLERDQIAGCLGEQFGTMGLRTAPLGQLHLDDVWVPESAVLGAVGGGSAIFASGMDWERVCLFATHVGTMERLIEQSVKRARSRRQFGHPIGAFQAIGHRLADMKVRLEAARLLIYRAASQLGRSRTVSLEAAMAKLFVSESLVTTALDAVQIHGGYGYVDGDIERALRDAVGSTIYSGTSEMQRSIIARWLGLP